MTGKQLKAWCATMHDDAVIQIKKGYTYDSWEDVDSEKLRALLETRPATIMKYEQPVGGEA